MILRYTVEGKFNATFTASTPVKDETEAYRKAISLSLLNSKEKYNKYTRAILYDDNNNKIKDIPICAYPLK